MRARERCFWCWGITLLAIVLTLPVAWMVSQSDTVERHVASRVFSHWIEPGHPERSILVWDRIRGVFPFHFKVYGSRWRDPTCLRDQPRASHHDCVTAFAPLIDVHLHPLSFIWGGRMEIERVTLPQLAVRSNGSASHAPHGPGRSLMAVDGIPEWPSFDHPAEFQTFRVDRVSLVPPESMLRAVNDLIAHPRAQIRVDHGAVDVMVFGSASIAPDGGDWEISATAYTVDDLGDVASHDGHNVWFHAQGYGDTRRVEARGTFSYAGHTRGEGGGAADWDALFGGEGEGEAAFVVEGDWGAVAGTVGLDNGLWCNVTGPQNASVVGRLGDLHDPDSWPRDVVVSHPRGQAHCYPDRCVMRAYGVEVILRPLTTGVVIEHDAGTAALTTCAPGNATTWAGTARGIGYPEYVVCGDLDTIVGTGFIKVEDGEVVEAELAGVRKNVTYHAMTARSMMVRANLTGVELDVAAPAWGTHRGPGLVALRVDPHGNWTLRSSDGDWARGWVVRDTGVAVVVGAGDVRGFAIEGGRLWSSRNEGLVWARAVNASSSVEFTVNADWTRRSWWDRLRHYRLDAHLVHGLAVSGVSVAGVLDVAARGGGRHLPRANVTLAGGHITRAETMQEVTNATGHLTIPSGAYTLDGLYHSPATEATFDSEGLVAFSPTSIEGETYTTYTTAQGQWDHIESSFVWEWGSTHPPKPDPGPE